MNTFVSHSLATVAGAAIGAAIGYFIAKTKYENDVEIQVRERVGDVIKKMKEPKEEKVEEPKEEVTEEKKSFHREEMGLKEAYHKMIEEEKYGNEEPADLYQIEDSVFGDDDRDCMSFFYNPDLDILLDEDGEEVETRQIYVGDFDLERFFDDDDHDSVYFRDDKLGRDYEILRTMKGPDED